jgi:superfamily II DNA/RNA helicase
VREQVRHLVLDEADRLLETGNRPTIMAMFQRLRKDAVGDRRLQVRAMCARGGGGGGEGGGGGC